MSLVLAGSISLDSTLKTCILNFWPNGSYNNLWERRSSGWWMWFVFFCSTLNPTGHPPCLTVSPPAARVSIHKREPASRPGGQAASPTGQVQEDRQPHQLVRYRRTGSLTNWSGTGGQAASPTGQVQEDRQPLQLVRYRRTGSLSNWSGKGGQSASLTGQVQEDRQPLQLVRYRRTGSLFNWSGTWGQAASPAGQVQEDRQPLQLVK